MTGFFGGELPGNVALREAGTEALPASTGQVLGAELAEGFAHAFPSYEISRAEAEAGTSADAGEAIGQAYAPARPMLSADEANAQYGIPGVLSFKNPVPAGVAQEMSERKHDELVRQDVLARSDNSLGSRLLGLGAQFVGTLPGLIDPLNVAASYVPVVSEARAALMSSSALGRLALGVAQGAAGQVALLPYQAAIASHDQEDLTMTNTLLDIALGGLLGGGLHMLAGARGPHGETDPLARADPGMVAELAAAPPQAAEAMLRAGVADLVEDRPVTGPALAFEASREPEAQQASQIINLSGMGRGMTDNLYAGLFDALQRGSDTFAGVRDPVIARARPFFEQELLRSPQDLQALVQAGYDPARAGLSKTAPAPAEEPPAAFYAPGGVAPGEARITPFEPVPRGPESLTQFLKRSGGVKDEGGELTQMNAHTRVPGLVNNQTGADLDEATRLAWERGYLPGEDRPRPRELLEALDREFRGRPVYSDEDAFLVTARDEADRRNDEIDRLALEHQLDTRGLTREQFWNALADRMSQEDLAREIAEQDAAHEDAYTAAVERARQARGLSLSRRAPPGFDIFADRPQGMYFSLVESPDTFVSPHEEEGSVTYSAIAAPKRPLELSPVEIEHARFGPIGKGPASAGVAALKRLLPEEEFERLRRLSKSELEREHQRFPAEDYLSFRDAYESLEALGAQIARERGYDALISRDQENPNFSEAAILDPEILQQHQLQEEGEPRTLEELETENAEQEAAQVGPYRSPKIAGAAQRLGADAAAAGYRPADEGALQTGAGPRGRSARNGPGAAEEAGARGFGADPAELVDEEIAELEREIAEAPEGSEYLTELAAMNQQQDDAEGWAKAIERAGSCLTRRA